MADDAGTCLGCQTALGPQARFCPGCGLARGTAPSSARNAPNPVSDAAAAKRDWSEIRGVLIFGGIWLATFIPLAWLPERHAATGMIVVGGLDAILVVIAAGMLGGIKRSQFDPRRVPAVWWGWALFALIVAIPINLAYHGAVISLLGLEDTVQMTKPFVETGYPLWVAMLCIVVQPAVIEELGFRGVIQGRLSKVIGQRESWIIVALSFGIIHLAWLSMPYLAALGLVLGWLRLRSGSLLPPMLLHALHNLCICLIELR